MAIASACCISSISSAFRYDSPFASFFDRSGSAFALRTCVARSVSLWCTVVVRGNQRKKRTHETRKGVSREPSHRGRIAALQWQREKIRGRRGERAMPEEAGSLQPTMITGAQMERSVRYCSDSKYLNFHTTSDHRAHHRGKRDAAQSTVHQCTPIIRLCCAVVPARHEDHRPRGQVKSRKHTGGKS